MTARLDEGLSIARRATELRLKRVWAHRQKLAVPVDVDAALIALWDSPRPRVLDDWAARMGLGQLEVDLFATLVALRTERDLGLQVGELLATYGRTTPTVSLLVMALADRWTSLEVEEALAERAPLVALGLITLRDPGPLLERRASVATWALRAFAGLPRELPDVLGPLGYWLERGEGPLPRLAGTIASELAVCLAAGGPPCTVVFEGERGDGRKQLGRALGGRPLVVADLTRIAGDEAAFSEVVRQALGYAQAHGALPWFELGVGRTADGGAIARGDEGSASTAAYATGRPSWRERRLLASMLEGFAAPCALSVSATDGWRWGASGRPCVRVPAPTSDLEVQEEAWAQAGATLDVELEPAVLARRFPLTVRGIAKVAERVAERRRAGAETSVAALLEEAREGLRQDTGMLARAVTTNLTWDDLVLPDELRRQIEEVVRSARHRSVVLDEYGMRRWGKGGFHILLAGEPGTGKTTLATLLGKALDRETLQVNLDQVFSRYVGETEKHLVKVFSLAERSRSLLLLDEADALLARRTDVKQANDRFGNLAVNVVLQLMEQYDVISVATTNRESGLDEASMRRFSYRFTIPPPDAEQRARLFRQMLPDRVDIDPDIDWDDLADKVEVSGGLIRNIMMRMAALTAANGDLLSREIAVAAVNREMKQLGRLPIRLD